MRSILLLIFCIFQVVIYIHAETVNFSVFNNNADSSVLKTVGKVAKLINADNRFTNVVTTIVNCAQDDQSNPEYCSQTENDHIVTVISEGQVSDKKIVTILDLKNTKAITYELKRAFTKYASSIFSAKSSKSENIDQPEKIEKLWDLFFKSQLAAKVPELLQSNKEQYDKYIQENKGEKVFFILYYTPDNFKNLQMLQYTLEAKENSNFKLSLINCKECQELCISSSPSLVAYKEGKEYKTFEGKITFQSIHDWTRKLKAPIMSILSQEIVPMYRSGVVPGFEEIQDTVAILFTTTKSHKVYQDYLEFAIKNHGKYHLSTLISKEIAKWPNHPAFVTMKPLEEESKAFVMFKNLTTENIAHYIETGIYPSIHQLTSASTLLEVFSLNQPLTIFLDIEKQKEEKQFAVLASDHPTRQNTSEFGIVKGFNLFGLYLCDMLGITDLRSSYILLNKEKTCLYKKLISNETKEEILHWISSSLKSPCQNKIQLNLVDFLKISQYDNYAAMKKKLLESKIQTHEEL